MSCVKYFTCISASLLYRCTACCSCACIYHRSCCRISTQHLKISLTTWSADEATPLVIVCDLGPYSRSFCSDSCFLSLGWSEELQHSVSQNLQKSQPLSVWAWQPSPCSQRSDPAYGDFQKVAWSKEHTSAEHTQEHVPLALCPVILWTIF